MLHNGIEYGDIQLICAACHLMLALGMARKEMAQEFDVSNKGVLEAFLIEIPHNFLNRDVEG
ncbi:AGAP012912-PA [Anopheles gambiae str. PEST]|uniref:phosphogluconate dehydrogenase (NADP(+)-dependent, decarboxylating) n=1 Tax=Anopheles gambiae TaxID=7165 RepID=A0NAK7_ANOGA|nr:AGAP012912-PA [Anopheles gambiae str. PEST]